MSSTTLPPAEGRDFGFRAAPERRTAAVATRFLTFLLGATAAATAAMGEDKGSGRGATATGKPDAESLEFFESRIRPVLAQECYECHRSGGKTKGGLALDWRGGMLEGGNSGAVIVPGDPESSLLLRSIRHDSEVEPMPRERAKLDDEVVRDFERWVRLGAPDPRDRPLSDEEVATETAWPAILERRSQWWSFQPVRHPDPPPLRDQAWSADPIDRFVLAGMEAVGLEPAPRADRETQLRRLAFVLTGLPPEPRHLEELLADDESPEAWAKAVDGFLESPQFGERWARHWMDWFRYADSHGSEGDPAIPFAWRYRDYLIRALNADVPYDTLVREHIAGDLLSEPRTTDDGLLSESALGTAQYRFVFHGFTPTDALDELVRFTDNQIEVVTKAFMGLTVSCARCHDHKFDAISQADYHALFGIFASGRPAVVTLDMESRNADAEQELESLKSRLRNAIAEEWSGFARALPTRLLASLGGTSSDAEGGEGAEGGEASAPDSLLREAMAPARADTGHPLHVWATLATAAEGAGPDGNEDDARARIQAAWSSMGAEFVDAERNLTRKQETWRSGGRWWRGAAGFESWDRLGRGTAAGTARPGEFHVVREGDRIVDRIHPAGFVTHALSTRHGGVVASPTFQIGENERLFVRAAGEGARVRYTAQNYPRSGLIFPVHKLDHEELRWIEWDLAYWNGDSAHIEATTALDAPVEINASGERSWFVLTEAVVLRPGDPSPGPEDALVARAAPILTMSGGPDSERLLRPPPSGLAEAAALHAEVLSACIEDWRTGRLDDTGAGFLAGWLDHGLLPNSLDSLPALRPLVERYREAEARTPVPVRAPGLLETAGFDQPLYDRGDHRKPGAPVPRRFLEAIDPAPYSPVGSGRLELAEDIAAPDNPFTARVAVNRAWHYVFGSGLVATTDNFGRLGETPSHPELLDYLASTFVQEDQWSLKRLIRRLVTTETFRLSSTPPARAREVDADNRLLSHARVRRLDAEAIRDAMLTVSGRLDPVMFGPAIGGNDPRRSVYVRVVRNDLDPFLSVFDAPEPLTTRGRRNVTNVPSQSLTLLNSPFVRELAASWAEDVLSSSPPGTVGDAERVHAMFRAAFSRRPAPDEVARALEFVREVQARSADAAARLADAREARAALLVRREAILRPVREALVEAAAGSGAGSVAGVGASGEPGLDGEALAVWDFTDSDVLGQSVLPVTLHGDAQVDGGGLLLGGSGHAEAGPLGRTLREKSLEAWVQLDTIEQSGGGVITVQSADGGIFDSIVFGERDPAQWLAGSNFFDRTEPFGGAPESADITERAVHVVVTYAEDGTIAGYRDGVPYGRPYRSDGPFAFDSGAVVLFGCRHGPPGGNRMLHGRILRARLFDRALSPEEVEAAARRDPAFVSAAAVAAALDPDQERAVAEIDAALAGIESEIADLETEAGGGGDPAVGAWADLAQSLLNAKEFVYLR